MTDWLRTRNASPANIMNSPTSTLSDSKSPFSQSQRSVNPSALLKSLLAILLLSGAAYAWYRFALHRNAQTVHDYAERCAETGDYATAAAQFSRYLQFRPDDGAARVRLAETYDLAYSKSGRAQRAIELYHEALGVAAEKQKPSIQVRLGELLLQTQQYLAAAEAADAVLARDSKNAQAANLRAMALYGQAHQGIYKGKPELVGASFETALALDPGDTTTAVTLAQIYREEPQYLSAAARSLHAAQRNTAANEILDRLVAAHPQQPESYLVRCQYRRHYNLPGADEDLKEAQKLGPQNLNVLLASGEALRAEAAALPPTSAAIGKIQSLREAACASYEQAIAVGPADYRGYLGLGETQSELGRTAAAIGAWQRGLEAAPAAAISFDMLLAKALLSTRQYDEAERHLDRLAREIGTPGSERNFPRRALLARMYKLYRARWLRAKNQPFQAIVLAQAVATGATPTAEEVNLAIEAWAVVAEAQGSLGRWAEAGDAWDKVGELAPKSPRYRALAAAAWIKANQPDRAVRALRLALGFGDGAEIRLALAAAVFRQNTMATKDGCDWQAVDAALRDARLAASRHPLPEPWRLDLLEAEITLARAESEGRHADGIRAAATIYRNVKLDEKAKSTAMPAIAMAFDRIDLHDDSDRTLAEWEKSAPPARARLVRAELAVHRKNYEEARRLVESGLDQLSPAERAQGLRFLVQLSLLERDWEKARKGLERLGDICAGDMDLLFAYAKLAQERQQQAEVERCLQNFIAFEGNDNRYGQFFRAIELLGPGASPGSPQLRAAEEVVEHLGAQYPEWADGLLLRCRLLEVEGHADKAINAYVDAIRHGAASLGTYERLIDLLGGAGRNAEAEGYLNSVLEQSLADEGTDLFEAQWMARRGDRDQGLAILRREAEQHPKNAALQLSIGQMLLATDRAKEAAAAFQRAAELVPDNLQAVLGLAIASVEINQADRARGLLAQLAAHDDPASAPRRMVMGQIAEMLGDEQAARGHYQAACDVPNLDAAARIPAITAYADFLLRHGPKEAADDPIRRLETISADEPAVLALRVRWLHTQRRDGEIGSLVEAAAARREKAAAAGVGGRAGHFKTTGALYELGEQYAAAETWYRRLLEIQPENFEPLATALAKQKRGGEAVSVCLDAARRTNPARAALLACSLRATGQIDDKDFQAADALIAAVEKNQPPAPFLAMLSAVRILQDRPEEAIALAERALAAQPQDIRTINNLATLLGERTGRCEEAVGFIDRAIELAGPQAWLLETRGQILLRGGRIEDAIAVLHEAAQSTDPDPRTLLYLARAYCLAGKFAEARTAFADAQKRNLCEKVLTPADRRLIKELEAEVLKVSRTDP
jgi:tetratricopeptide (TPR) repeat protein/lipopolysaccharide biosynthesis regulator YciM